jgi:orotate phosphoribosyltransferase
MDRERLLRLLTERSFQRRKVKLSSGKESDFYIDCKKTALTAEGHYLVGRALFALIRREAPRAVGVGGLTLGADPVATAMLHAAAAAGELLDAFTVRKAEKAHGLQRRIEGPDVAGRRVLAVEDTSTTGGSVLTAVEALRAVGAEVIGVAVIVDRNTGARQRVEAAGLPYRFAISAHDLGLT